MRLVEGGVFSTEALKYSVRRLNQLGYFQNLEQSPGGRRPEDAQREERSRRHAEAGRAEPQPADLRRRRLAVRGLLRPAVVPDLELPRPRRVADAVAAGRLARRELPGRVHRAVPVRPQHHRRRRRLQAQPAVHQPVHAGIDRRQPPVRVPGRRLLADVPDLQLREQRQRRQRPRTRVVLHGSATLDAAQQSVPAGLAAHRPGRQAHHQQGRAELRLQHGRQPDLPDHGPPPLAARATSPAWAATPTSSSRASRRSASSATPRARRSASARRSNTSGRTAARWCCRSSSGCSWAASTASAASTSARSARATRTPTWCSAATRACCSTPNT